MQPLEKTLRSQLERAVKEARKIAESAAAAALEQLGVGAATPYAHLSEEERDLRRRLRIHGRQLGDHLHASLQTQELDCLIEEVAYEHWHRMLFARFLAENNLLMYPDPDDPVAITLEECEELAADEGATNGWDLAARYAARMLPQIFRPNSPVFQLHLPPEYQQKLEQLLADLPQETFTASDSLGWVYQFWQAKRKDEVNASEVKIGADELPAVTQLFTEHYMVSFLLDNTLGAWWQANHADKTCPVPLTYLRMTKEGVPAAGCFNAWPKNLGELKVLDPSCGSGHFLVAAFLMLVPMRMTVEGLNEEQAIHAVLRDNIFGLELEQRCIALAVFALALEAWRYPNANGYRPLPEIQLACSGLAVRTAKAEWKQLGLDKKNLTIALDWMHDAFKDAPVLGSLINPARTNAVKIVEWSELSQALGQALNNEMGQNHTEEQQEATVVAQGLAKAATLLADQYHLVITNVPYLARGKQDDKLKDFCERNYPEAKNDLATVFLDRCLEFCVQGGTTSVVLPQNWLFLTSYKKFREKLLRQEMWHLIARLGPGAFETISGEVVKAILLTLSRGNANEVFTRPNSSQLIHGMDVSEARSAVAKANQLLTAELKVVEQAKLLENPDAMINFEISACSEYFSEYASCYQGSSTGDNNRYVHYFWEIGNLKAPFVLMESVPIESMFFGGKQSVINWKGVKSSQSSATRGWDAFNKYGVSIGQMANLPATLYLGNRFPNTTPVIIPSSTEHLAALWAFCSTREFSLELRKINQKLSVDNGYVGKIPFNFDHWDGIAKERYSKGLPKPFSNDPAQWIFHGHLCGSVIWDEESKWTVEGPLRSDDTVLQVAVARLLGYCWPTELDVDMELADEQRAWVNRCEELFPYTDEDGIVCIPPVRGEAAASDRLLNLLAAAYGDSWSNDVLTQVLNNAGHAGKSLETWLRDKFFTHHCKMFKHRPFIWHIWDGLPDGFAALVNYHKLDLKLMKVLIHTYLGDWISRQKQDIANGLDGAHERLAAAEGLKKKLMLILEGEAPYDIYVRWKPIEEQPVGWDPDLNDGVRLNIRPFMTVPDVGKKDAGVLRDKPNVKWTKDRGKDVESAPWYPVFNGDRINDHHLSLAEKQASQS